MIRDARRRTVAVAFLLAAATPAAAQRPDSILSLDAIIVSAERARTPLASSAAAVSVLTGADLARMSAVTLADALRRVPGFALIDSDGLGHDPQLVARGFYGGGEAEYVVVLVDGRPVNDVPAGLIAWDALPVSGIERVEVVRGGASALWGDAAIGGVINVITRAPGDRVRWTLAGGSRGSLRAGADATAGRLAIAGDFTRTDGFRAHAARTSGRVRGTWTLASGTSGSLRADAAAHWRAFDEPGPLAGARVDADRTASDVFFRFDHTDDRGYRLGLAGDLAVPSRARLSGSVLGDLRDTEGARTLVLAPEFADTKQRTMDSARVLATALLSIEGTGLSVDDRLIVGIDASYAAVAATYHVLLSGSAEVYSGAAGTPGPVDSSGQGDRVAAAAFLQYTLAPAAPVRLSAGLRADWLRDGFDVLAPEEPVAFDATHAAISPKIGVNVEYLRNRDAEGHAWISAARSFKAPTLDQLFDRRRLPVPFPPFSVTTSNPELDPQHGTSVEAGIYQRLPLASDAWAAALSLALHRMDMKDELDFYLQTLRYVNIGRSRHRGIEAGLSLATPHAGTAFVNYTGQYAVAGSGEHAGRRLKAVPRHFTSAGASIVAAGRLRVGATVSHVRGVFLDDANTLALPPWTRVDARLEHPVGGLELFLDVRNVLDARFSTTGFPDPAGSAVVYYRPAAGRTLELGIRSRG